MHTRIKGQDFSGVSISYEQKRMLSEATPNAGRRWTDIDIGECVLKFKQDISLNVIAVCLGRTTIAIQCKLRDLGYLDAHFEPTYKSDFKPTYKSVVQPQLTKEQSMPFSIKIETKTFVNGNAASELGNDDIFSIIIQAEAEIERLDKIKNKPKALVKVKDELTKGIMELVNIVDARGNY